MYKVTIFIVMIKMVPLLKEVDDRMNVFKWFKDNVPVGGSYLERGSTGWDVAAWHSITNFEQLDGYKPIAAYGKMKKDVVQWGRRKDYPTNSMWYSWLLLEKDGKYYIDEEYARKSGDYKYGIDKNPPLWTSISLPPQAIEFFKGYVK